MKNILSYKPGTKFKGKQIKDWIKYHTENQTSHSLVARNMVKYLNIKDDKDYTISKGTYQASARTFQVMEVK